MKTSKLLRIPLAFALIFSLAACGSNGGASSTDAAPSAGTAPAASSDAQQDSAESAAPAGQYKMGVGTTTVGEHPQNHYLDSLQAAVADKGVTLEVFPSSQLGSVSHMLQLVQDGGIQSVLVPSANMAALTNAFEIINLPYLVDSTKSGVEILNSSSGDGMREAVKPLGLKLLAITTNGPRVIISNDSFTQLSDMSGKKIRVIAGPIYENTVKAWGGSPVAMDAGELYTSLQQKAIDAVDTDPGFIFSVKLHEIAKNMLLPGGGGHGVVMAVFLVNEQWFNGLPADVREAMVKAAAEIALSEADYEMQYTAKILDDIEAAGVALNVPDESFEAALRSGADTVHEQFLTDHPDLADLYSAITGR